MNNQNAFEVIIVGGSYAGLSAAMTLGRSLRKVLVIDSGEPCNKQTPHSHNFITQDGQTPQQIASIAIEQVKKYTTVEFKKGVASHCRKVADGFEIKTDGEEIFVTRKLLFATGITDLLPDIDGFSECWGISVLHCPYCHGYEVKNTHIGLLGNGDVGFELCKLISNWTNKLTLFTNGKSTLTTTQLTVVNNKSIQVNEKEIASLRHNSGNLKQIRFKDGSAVELTAMFARIGFKQHCDIPALLGCELTEHGHIKIDDFNKTTVPGVFAAGDNTTFFRSVSVAAAAGTKAGVFINKEMIDEVFF